MVRSAVALVGRVFDRFSNSGCASGIREVSIIDVLQVIGAREGEVLGSVSTRALEAVGGLHNAVGAVLAKVLAVVGGAFDEMENGVLGGNNLVGLASELSASFFAVVGMVTLVS